MVKLKFSLIALLLALTGCSSIVREPEKPDTVYHFTVLHTNDTHGRFWSNRDGEYGMAARQTVVDIVRNEVQAAGGYTLLLDGGDVNTGVPESDLQDAVPDFMGMNQLAYDAMAVGNHEFDKGLTVLQKQRELAHFPMLSANIYRKGERMFEPYRVFQLGGLRVAVLGLTTEDTRLLANPDNVSELEFRKPVDEARTLIPELRSKADVVIAATHMGHFEDGQHGRQAPGDVELARAVKGLDLIVGGHTQNPVCMKAPNVRERNYIPGSDCTPDRQNGTWIVQAHEWGKYVGRADFEFRRGQLSLLRYTLIPINLKQTLEASDGTLRKVLYDLEIAEDSKMLDLLRPYQQAAREMLEREIGSSDSSLDGDRNIVRNQQTDLGQLIGRAMMEKTHADFAIVNSGGIRSSLPAGPISYRDILSVHPFGNTIGTVELSGHDVLEYLGAAAAMEPGSGGFAQFVGIDIRIVQGQVQQASIAGNEIDPEKTYRMAVNSFMAAGGDGYPILQRHPAYVDSGFVDADVLQAFIGSHSPIAAVQFDPGSAVVRE
jgi:5'-nucleotidase/UDP-sugar diphosphatase